MTVLCVAGILKAMKITFDLLHLGYFVLVILGIVVLVYLLILLKEALRTVRQANQVIAELSKTNEQARQILAEVEGIVKPFKSDTDFSSILGMLLPILFNIVGPLVGSIFGGKKQGGSGNG